MVGISVRSLHDAQLAGAGGGLGTGRNRELVQNVGDVTLDGVDA